MERSDTYIYIYDEKHVREYKEIHITKDILWKICYSTKYTQIGNGRILELQQNGLVWPGLADTCQQPEGENLGIKDICLTNRVASLWAPNMALHVINLHPQVGHLSEKFDLGTCLTPTAANWTDQTTASH